MKAYLRIQNQKCQLYKNRRKKKNYHLALEKDVKQSKFTKFSKRKRNGVNFIEYTVSVYFWLGATFSLCHSTTWSAKLSDSPCLNMQRTIDSPITKWMSFVSTKFSSWVTLKTKYLGSSNRKQHSWWLMQEKLHWRFTKSIIGQINRLQESLFTRLVLKKYPCISIKSNVSALRTSFSIHKSRLIYRCFSI